MMAGRAPRLRGGVRFYRKAGPLPRAWRGTGPPLRAMQLTEDELVAAITRVVSGPAPGVRVGIGDDAALATVRTGELALTTDLLVEGSHFERRLIAPRDLGYKAIAVNLSDLAAMGASPRFALVSLGLPAAVDAAWVVELYGGMVECSSEYAVSIVGGDLSR